MISLTRQEKDWVLYDVGNSAFVMLTATVIPIYFKNVAEGTGMSAADSTAYFGYASSLVTILAAVLGPVLGAVADIRGFKKPVFACFMGVGVAGCPCCLCRQDGSFFLESMCWQKWDIRGV